MKTFEYHIKTRMGLHSRPASSLFALMRKFQSTIYIYKEERCAKASRIVDILELNAKKGNCIRFEIDGEDEEKAYQEIKRFCEHHL